MDNNNQVKNKILWLSIVQGWAILLVVIGHVNGFTYANPSDPLEMYPLSYWVHRLIYAFHMPLFMFVSGGLLYYSRLSRGWHTPALYKDKLKRLLIPYLFFIAFAFIVKAPIAGMSKRGMDVSLHGFLQAYFDPGNGPLAEMWFIGTLMWLMLMYPLYKVVLKSGYLEVLLLLVTLVPFVVEVPIDIKGWFNLQGLMVYTFYFFGGILFFKYDGMRYLSKGLWKPLLLTALFLAAAISGFGGKITSSILGILMSFGWAIRVADRWPRLFGSFRDHSFQIFLVAIFPQMLIELVVWKRFHSSGYELPFYIISVSAALGCGVLISLLTSRIKIPFFRWIFGHK